MDNKIQSLLLYLLLSKIADGGDVSVDAKLLITFGNGISFTPHFDRRK